MDTNPLLSNNGLNQNIKMPMLNCPFHIVMAVWLRYKVDMICFFLICHCLLELKK